MDWNYKFNQLKGKSLEDFLIKTQFGIALLESSTESEEGTILRFFQNGDRFTVDLSTGNVNWDTIHPGDHSGSKINMRLHQMLAKGILSPIN